MSEAQYGKLRLETLFVEVDGHAEECTARVRAAMLEEGLDKGEGKDANSSWTLGSPLFDPDSSARHGLELFPPSDLELATRAAWSMAHRLTEALGGDAHVEPTFLGDVEVASAEDLAAASSAGGSPTPAPDDVRWHHDRTGVAQAHARIRAAGTEPGDGVLIGHPDTGYTEHEEVFAGVPTPMDVASGLNLLEHGRDPLDPRTSGRLKQPGHGTATAAVAIARDGTQVERSDGTLVDLLGIAPAARIVPIRVTESVIILGWQRRLARAIEHAVDKGCRVISISLGGLGGSRLNRSIRYAEREGVVIVAAAGNQVRFVVAPATHPLTVAAAACDSNDRPWSGSSRGRAVTITAPGHQVWVAGWAGPRAIAKPGSGTSFAAAFVAGAAALWLSHHADTLSHRRAHASRLFRAALRATARRLPTLPPSRYGAGLVDCDALVATPPPDDGLEGEATRDGMAGPGTDDRSPEVEALMALLEDEAVAAAGAPQPANAEPWYEAMAPAMQSELAFHLTVDPGFRRRVQREGRPSVTGSADAPSTASAASALSSQLTAALASATIGD